MQLIDCMLLHVAKVHTMKDYRCLTNATGFFFQRDGLLFFITARHVVLDSLSGHCPDWLNVPLHVNDRDFQQVEDFMIPLYIDGTPQWYEHPQDESIDLVAVMIHDVEALQNYLIYPFQFEDIVSSSVPLPLGQDAILLGFPLGFQDQKHHLPIARRATIASSFAYPFGGNRYFLTDSRLHRGMSGSPVIAKVPDYLRPNGRDGSRWRLLGIHTSAVEVSDRDPLQDDRLALNTSWYAELLLEILPERVASGSISSRACDPE